MIADGLKIAAGSSSARSQRRAASPESVASQRLVESKMAEVTVPELFNTRPEAAGSLDARFQSRVVPSSQPLMSQRPSGLKT